MEVTTTAVTYNRDATLPAASGVSFAVKRRINGSRCFVDVGPGDSSPTCAWLPDRLFNRDSELGPSPSLAQCARRRDEADGGVNEAVLGVSPSDWRGRSYLR